MLEIWHLSGSYPPFSQKFRFFCKNSSKSMRKQGKKEVVLLYSHLVPHLSRSTSTKYHFRTMVKFLSFIVTSRRLELEKASAYAPLSMPPVKRVYVNVSFVWGCAELISQNYNEKNRKGDQIRSRIIPLFFVANFAS